MYKLAIEMCIDEYMAGIVQTWDIQIDMRYVY